MSRRIVLLFIALSAFALDMMAQDASQNSGVRRREVNRERRMQQEGPAASPTAPAVAPKVSERALSHYDNSAATGDADVQWMKVIYRQLDLNDDKNAALYFPEDPIDGQENLFRIIMRLLCDNQIDAFEYLDGREIFTDKYKVKLSDVLDRFHIIYQGGGDKGQPYQIDESDVPTNEVLSYYIIERWEYDTRGNRLKTTVDAICPVLHRAGDFGGDAVKYPMFWVKFADLRPYLAQQAIFTSDDNNLPSCTYDDFFNLTMYNGDIYKTRNLKNQSLMQLYPDPDELKRAQDSIQAYLDNFEKKLWVPDREEILARQEAAEAAAAEKAPSLDDAVAAPNVTEDKSDNKPMRTTKRGAKDKDKNKKAVKPKNSKPKSTGSSSSSAARSVRKKK